MCGLAGYVAADPTLRHRAVIDTMLEAIAHRGKDNRGFTEEQFAGNGSAVVLGHNRLSIIDLSENGNQPFTYKHFRIVFNGEIYNYREVKEELVRAGHSFVTASDTEVIIKAFEQYGFGCFSKLNGMFAIAIYDSQKGKIHLVRDRLGVKPLYYAAIAGNFVFGSELKAVLAFPELRRSASLRTDAIGSYFRYGYVNSSQSVFDHVLKVDHAHIVTYDIGTREMSTEQYWNLYDVPASRIDDYQQALEELSALVASAVKYRLVADVPVGIFLSSGIDSNLVLRSALTTDLPSIHAYTLRSLDFQEKAIPDPPRIRREFVATDLEQTWKDYQYLCSMYDEPFSDAATIGLYQLSKTAAATSKVVMVGDGGDEVLAGYQPYKTLTKYYRSAWKNVFRMLYAPVAPLVRWYLRRSIESKNSFRLSYYHAIFSSGSFLSMAAASDGITDRFVQRLTRSRSVDPPARVPEDDNTLLSLLNHKTSTELVRQLNYKTDIAGMLNTLEIREPLLDYRLFEFQQRLTPGLFHTMVANGKAKQLLRDILEKKLGMDVSVMEKKGFHVDLENVFRTRRQEIDTLLHSYESERIDMNVARTVWEEWKQGKVHFLIINRIVSYVLWERAVRERVGKKL